MKILRTLRPTGPGDLPADIVSSHSRMTTAAEAQSTAASPLACTRAPEFELLLSACGTDSNRLARALETPIYWDTVLRLAEHHRVVPALNQALQGRQDVPVSIQSALGARFQKNAVKALRF